MNELAKYDTFEGTVLYSTMNGAIIALDNGLKAFAFFTLNADDRVLCSVRKVDKEKQRITVDIESVVAYAA